MNDPFPALLHPALDQKKPRTHHLRSKSLEDTRPHENIRYARLIFQGYKNGLAVSGPLPDKHDACRARPAAISKFAGLTAG